MEFKGTVKDIIFQNEESGYVIGRLQHDEGILTFTGTIPWIFEGQLLVMQGQMIKHPTFGNQLKVDRSEEMVPESREGLEKYLASGIISGVGPVTAKRLVDTFGLKVFDVMDEDLEQLLQVEGIGQKKLELIRKSYEKSREVRNIMVFLQSYGVTPKQCMKIYYRFGQNSIEVVRENPYILSKEVASIGFRTADRIAGNLGIEKDSPFRIQSGIDFMVNSFAGLGNTCMPVEKLLRDGAETLGVGQDLILDNLQTLVLNGEMMVEDIEGVQCAFTPVYWHGEVNIAGKLLAMMDYPYPKLPLQADEFIEDYETNQNIKLHDLQKEAVRGVLENGIEIITGGPGTGKTTIIKCILAMLKEARLKVLMAAPTGRAAKRMTETTGEESKTIHRLLDLGITDDGDEIGEGGELDCDCVIIDEASMVDVILMNKLLAALKPGTRLILVGDADQLPSVGPGRVLGDLIASGGVKVVSLEVIYRQGEESMITVNAHLINEGKQPKLNTKGGDFFFMSGGDQAGTADTLVELVNTRLPRFNGTWDKVRDFQILSPMRKGDLGINRLNEVLKDILNPSEEKHSFTSFRTGDKVMQNRNNYQLKSRFTQDFLPGTLQEETGVFNGDVGFIVKIDDEDQIVTVFYDNERFVDYTPAELDDLELAYAITIHKSQGSEFPVILIPLFMGPPMLLNRNLIYTAVTRARQMVVLVGDQRALQFMINNDRSTERYTSLGFRIKKSVALLE
ncbi:MAG: ATP-dependent RecD-like DNA helicase [Clostridium sp.]|nr:ATP-dependent RecD-like DNA helicase [Clostridium sp.]